MLQSGLFCVSRPRTQDRRLQRGLRNCPAMGCALPLPGREGRVRASVNTNFTETSRTCSLRFPAREYARPTKSALPNEPPARLAAPVTVFSHRMSGSRRRLILFARFPEPGRVKTRLIPALGAEGAAALHRRLVLRTLRTALVASRAAEAELEVRFTGGNENAMHLWLGDEVVCRAQCDGDLGRRMADAFEDSFREGARAAVVIGSDCPELTADLLGSAFDKLSQSSVVFGPARDGGYYLVGLTQPVPQLFRDIHWSTGTVLTESIFI